MTEMLIVAGVGFVLVLVAWGMWALVRSWDRTNAILAAAPQMPIRMVNVWDPVWIRGEVECHDPVYSPHFGQPVIHYDYKLEQYVTRTRTTSDGKTETYSEWQTIKTASEYALFSVYQAEGKLLVQVDKAQWQYEESATETFGNLRHSCTFTPMTDLVSVVGVVGERKATLEPLMHVPLIVTPRERQSYLNSAESAERWAARFGYLFLLIGFALVGFGLARYFQTRGSLPVGWWDGGAGVVGLITGLGTMTLFWLIRTYNSMVIFRTRAEQSWSGIDVHLKQRYDLIPNLIEVVKGYAGHEQNLFEHLTQLRTEAIADRRARVRAETDVVADMTRIALVAESYPDLKANTQYRILAKNLTALEDKIAHARGFFNDSVAEYNTNIAKFPANLAAGVFGFRSFPLFSADLHERAVPQFKL